MTDQERSLAIYSLDYDEDENECQNPCDPDVGCGECSGYWEVMVEQGFWDKDRHEWTDKGMREMMK